MFDSSRPRNTIQYGAKAENAIWDHSRKNKQAEPNAGNAIGTHDVGRPKAATHHVVATASGGRHHVMSYHVGSAFAFACMFCFGPVLYFLSCLFISFPVNSKPDPPNSKPHMLLNVVLDHIQNLYKCSLWIFGKYTSGGYCK